jgi:hypothetical protein
VTERGWQCPADWKGYGIRVLVSLASAGDTTLRLHSTPAHDDHLERGREVRGGDAEAVSSQGALGGRSAFST